MTRRKPFTFLTSAAVIPLVAPAIAACGVSDRISTQPTTSGGGYGY